MMPNTPPTKINITDGVFGFKRIWRGSMIPKGAAKHKRSDNHHLSFSTIVLPGNQSEVAAYFEYIYADYPDVLTTADVAEMTGLCNETALCFIRAGKIKSLGLNNSGYIIPKQYLLEFVLSAEYIKCKSNSAAFKKVIGGFELWRAAKLSR